jgi:hypothetical protein
VTFEERLAAALAQADAEADSPWVVATEDDSPWVVVDGTNYCIDCQHSEAEHSRPDPGGNLAYGMGNCGNCITCSPD